MLSLPRPALTGVEDLALSRHRRSFVLLSTPPSDPGPIDLWHLWLPG
ncbi:MAG: hypothetical protein ABIO70_17655 [Pseudomonadota bacterium]